MIYIVRHGQTEMNNAKVLQGRSNHPLNNTGVEQAKEVGAWFREQGIQFDRIYSSPLTRAIQTAYLIAGREADVDDAGEPKPKICTDYSGATVITDERLIEMDYGPYEGMSLADPAPEVITFFSDFQNNPAPEGMESLSDILKRSGEFLDEIRQIAVNETILISTHAIAMKGLLEYLTPESNGAYWSKYIGNCEVYTAEVVNGYFTVPEPLPIREIEETPGV